MLVQHKSDVFQWILDRVEDVEGEEDGSVENVGGSGGGGGVVTVVD